VGAKISLKKLARVAKFFLVHDNKTGQNVPNELKIYQMAIKYLNIA
jgi:hypothetical protein